MGAAARILCVAAMFCLCVLAYTAGRWGLADLNAVEPRSAIRQWAAGKAMPVPGDVEAVRIALERVLRLEPDDPGVKEELGFVHGWAAAQAFAGGDGAQHAAAALRYLHTAVRERPVSSYAWAALAAAKWRMRITDAQFEHALREASRLGPWEPQVQLALVDTGLQAWPVLPATTRQVVQDTVGRSLLRQDAAVFAIARKHGRLDVVCGARGVARSRFAYACI